MRRSDKSIEDRNEIDAVIRGADFCVMSLSDDGRPYGIPMNFGYEDGVIYLHSAPGGRKMEVLANNDTVSLVFVEPRGVVAGTRACRWSYRYRSVMAEGRAEVLKDPRMREAGLRAIMRHYAGDEFVFAESDLGAAAVIRITLTELSGKRSPAAPGDDVGSGPRSKGAEE
ncbi:MAG: pyridoxamine 5'-phosphate oxidase family protein [Desulfobacterales bacterium]